MASIIMNVPIPMPAIFPVVWHYAEGRHARRIVRMIVGVVFVSSIF